VDSVEEALDARVLDGGVQVRDRQGEPTSPRAGVGAPSRIM
jgi:hypothetical protein